MEEDLCGGFSRRRGGKRSILGRGSSLSKDAKAEMCSKHWGARRRPGWSMMGRRERCMRKYWGGKQGPDHTRTYRPRQRVKVLF